jgi:hypothetical protein
MAVLSDLFNESSATVTPQGTRAVRVFAVDNLTDGTPSKRVADALAATGVPEVGDEHPSISDAYAREVEARMVGPTQARVTVVYEPMDLRDQLRLGLITKIVAWRSATVTRDSGTDINGAVMQTAYNGTRWQRDEAGLIYESTGDYDLTSISRANITDAVAVATYTKWVSGALTATDVTGLVGKVNDDTWSTYSAKTWLCAGVTYEPDQGGGFLTYELQYNPATWQFEARTIQTWGGFNVEPPEIGVGNGGATGITLYDVYDEADFDGIGSL